MSLIPRDRDAQAVFIRYVCSDGLEVAQQVNFGTMMSKSVFSVFTFRPKAWDQRARAIDHFRNRTASGDVPTLAPGVHHHDQALVIGLLSSPNPSCGGKVPWTAVNILPIDRVQFSHRQSFAEEIAASLRVPSTPSPLR